MSAVETATRKEIYDLKSYDPKHSIGGLLGRVKLAMVGALDAELAPLDITAAQFVILKAIAAGDKAAAMKEFQAQQSVIDRVADKKVVHKNLASRSKHRLAHAIKSMA